MSPKDLLMVHNEGGGGDGEESGFFEIFTLCPIERGGARKRSSANLLFLKQFLNKIFWVC